MDGFFGAFGERDGMLAAKRSVLAMAASQPSVSVSNFGGWQSLPDLFANATSKNGSNLLLQPCMIYELINCL